MVLSVNILEAEARFKNERDQMKHEKNCKNIVSLLKDFDDIKKIANRIEKDANGMTVCWSARLSISWIACNLSSMPLLGCCATGENTTMLHRSSVMFYTGS